MAGRNRKRPSPADRKKSRSHRLRAWILAPLRLILLSVLGAGLGYGGYQVAVFLRSSPALSVRSIEVRGAEKTPVAELLRAADLAEGMNIFSVDVDRIRKQLERLPWVRRVLAQRVIPNAVVLEVEEHRPVAMINLAGLYYLNRAGEVFKRIAPGETVDFPLVTGIARALFSEHPERCQEPIRQALALVEQVGQIPCLATHQVAEVHWDELMGSTLILDPGALRIQVSSALDWQRSDELCQVLAEVKRRGLDAHTILLDQADYGIRATIRLDKAEALALAKEKDPSKKGVR